jgi:uncharacterized SAM-binding protein YcdF (DUF218 family)
MRPPEHGGIIVRLMALMTLLVLFGAAYAIRRPLMRLAGDFWIIDEPIAHADAILVLGDDNFGGERASRAAGLFRAGWAPQVVASGRMLRPYMSVAELIGRDLENRGVPATAVIRFPQQASDTNDEAQALRRLADEHGWHQVLVVTSNYHTRRARYIFRKVFPDGARVVSAPDSDFDPDKWWTSRKSQKLFFDEGVGYCIAMWELRGFSPVAPSTKPAGQPASVAPHP